MTSLAFSDDSEIVFSKSCERAILAHDWPGNVRELENVIQRAVLMARNNVITEKELIFDTNFCLE